MKCWICGTRLGLLVRIGAHYREYIREREACEAIMFKREITSLKSLSKR